MQNACKLQKPKCNTDITGHRHWQDISRKSLQLPSKELCTRRHSNNTQSLPPQTACAESMKVNKYLQHTKPLHNDTYHRAKKQSGIYCTGRNARCCPVSLLFWWWFTPIQHNSVKTQDQLFVLLHHFSSQAMYTLVTEVKWFVFQVLFTSLITIIARILSHNQRVSSVFLLVFSSILSNQLPVPMVWVSHITRIGVHLCLTWSGDEHAYVCLRTLKTARFHEIVPHKFINQFLKE